jgi:DNA repair photolyase
LGWVKLTILPGISDRPEQLPEVVKAAREAGATGVWTNLLILGPGTREHFLQHLAEDWPELVPRYRDLHRGRAYLGADEVKPLKRRVSALARQLGVADRRVRPLEPEAEPEQLALAV